MKRVEAGFYSARSSRGFNAFAHRGGLDERPWPASVLPDLIETVEGRGGHDVAAGSCTIYLNVSYPGGKRSTTCADMFLVLKLSVRYTWNPISKHTGPSTDAATSDREQAGQASVRNVSICGAQSHIFNCGDSLTDSVTSHHGHHFSVTERAGARHVIKKLRTVSSSALSHDSSPSRRAAGGL